MRRSGESSVVLRRRRRRLFIYLFLFFSYFLSRKLGDEFSRPAFSRISEIGLGLDALWSPIFKSLDYFSKISTLTHTIRLVKLPEIVRTSILTISGIVTLVQRYRLEIRTARRQRTRSDSITFSQKIDGLFFFFISGIEFRKFGLL